MRIRLESFEILLLILVTVLVLPVCTNFAAVAYGATQSQQFVSNTIAGDALKNDPFVAKILFEIDYSKKQIAQLEQNQKDAQLNAQFIEQQRAIAKTLEQQALQMLQVKTEQNSSENAYKRFLLTVSNNNTKDIFVGQFDFMKQRVDAGHIAMKQILAKGGTWEEAMTVFSQYAAIKRTEMISLNTQLNIKHGFADPVVQAAFNQNGILPDGYVKTADEINRVKN